MLPICLLVLVPLGHLAALHRHTKRPRTRPKHHSSPKYSSSRTETGRGPTCSNLSADTGIAGTAAAAEGVAGAGAAGAGATAAAASCRLYIQQEQTLHVRLFVCLKSQPKLSTNPLGLAAKR